MMILLPLVLIWSRDPMRYRWPSKVAVLGLFIVGATSFPINGSRPSTAEMCHATESWDAKPGEELVTQEPRVRMREGSRLGTTVGKFVRSGRRWVFDFESPAAATSIQMRVLENLALQRVADAITHDASDVRWTVTGVVSEFGDENCL